MKYLPLIASLLIVSPAFGQGAEPLSVFTLRGDCEELRVGEQDLLAICANEFMQVSYDGGAMELSIWTDDPTGRFFVFSGMGERTDAGFAVQLDSIIESKDSAGEDITEHQASGQCALSGDPTAAPAHYKCTATDANGRDYAFAFRTDGSQPESMLD